MKTSSSYGVLMPVVRYMASVLLYLLMLPISTPAAFIESIWTRPDDVDWGCVGFTINPFDTYGDGR